MLKKTKEIVRLTRRICDAMDKNTYEYFIIDLLIKTINLEEDLQQYKSTLSLANAVGFTAILLWLFPVVLSLTVDRTTDNWWFILNVYNPSLFILALLFSIWWNRIIEQAQQQLREIDRKYN